MKRKGVCENCAYHPAQKITSFCKCLQCLLPVCVTCVRMHCAEHQQSGSRPDFQDIDRVVAAIEADYSKALKSFAALRGSLLEIERSRKEKEQILKRLLIEKRQELILRFEEILREIEKRIVDRVTVSDTLFLNQLQDIDARLEQAEITFQSAREQLKGQECLKSVIVYWGKAVSEKIISQIQAFQAEAVNLKSSRCDLKIEKQALNGMRKQMDRYMIIQTQ